jgi:hypothetical protein
MAETNKPVTHLALFQEKTVRRVWYDGRWYFSIIDVIAILTDTAIPGAIGVTSNASLLQKVTIKCTKKSYS